MVRIGALTTHAELAASAELRDHCPALAEAARHVGDPAVRNRGTIGGNVAHADPASDLPTVLAALDARFVVSGGTGTTTVEASEFFKGMMTTALGEHDLLTAIEVPGEAERPGSGVREVHASRLAVRRHRCRGGRDRQRREVHGGGRGGRRARPSADACARRSRRRSSVRRCPPRPSRRRQRLVVQDLGDDILGDSMRPRTTGRPSLRSGSNER